ncbi:MAG: substrate-binding domain-containing protein [Lachnospiraceae bacterium]|nr:substrate-binding domain-containing protein [Lachnospiraceae bacterium]
MKKQLKKILAGTLCAAMLTGTVCLAAEADYAIIVSDALPEEVAAKEGPNGEVPESAALLGLTEEEVATLKEGNYTAAICWHQGGDTYITKHTQFITELFAEVGIEVVAVTDAGLSTEQQVADIETVIAMKPDIIIGEPVDAVGTRDAWQKVTDAGIALVFMDASGEGMTAGTDYVGCVSSDNYGNGVIAARLLADAIGGEGKVGMCYRNVNLYPVEQRKIGFMDTMAAEYPDIEIAEATPCEAAVDCEDAMNAMLLKHADLKGAFGWYDEPCVVISAAARTSGKDEFAVTGCDLGEDVALALAQNDMVAGIAAQRIKAQARALAILGCYGILEKEAPAFVAVPGLAVTHDNVVEGWEECYGEQPSQAILDAIG